MDDGTLHCVSKHDPLPSSNSYQRKTSPKIGKPNTLIISEPLPNPIDTILLTRIRPDATPTSIIVVPDDRRYTSIARSPSVAASPNGTPVNIGEPNIAAFGASGSMFIGVVSDRSRASDEGGRLVTSRSSTSSTVDAASVRTPTSVTLVEIPSTETEIETSPTKEPVSDSGIKLVHSKWGKLRQAVKATSVFTSAISTANSTGGSSDGDNARLGAFVGATKIKKQRSQHHYDASRRDSFLERFSTRQSGGSSAAAAMSSSSYHQQHNIVRKQSESTRDSEIDAKVMSTFSLGFHMI